MSALLLAMSAVTFALMGYDKSRSKRPGARRVPERVLLLCALLGGGVGGFLGMRLFRHKTRHWYFALGLPFLAAAQLLLLLYLHTPGFLR